MGLLARLYLTSLTFSWCYKTNLKHRSLNHELHREGTFIGPGVFSLG